MIDKYKKHIVFLHMRYSKNLSIDERMFSNHNDNLSSSLKIARELVIIAKMILEE